MIRMIKHGAKLLETHFVCLKTCAAALTKEATMRKITKRKIPRMKDQLFKDHKLGPSMEHKKGNPIMHLKLK